MTVATIDYTDADAPREFSRSLRDTGFAVLENHPVPADLVPTIGREWLAFFASSAKEKYVHTGAAQDGFFPCDPVLAGEPPRDRKEFFQVRPGGQYPAEVSAAALEYFAGAAALAAELLSWIEARSPAEVRARYSIPLRDMLAGATGSLLRVQHYLPLPAAPRPDLMRAIAHTDLNLLTVLPTPQEPGLQVRDVNGDWHEIPRRDGSIVINIGEMLQEASGGYFPATLHRVRPPAGGEALGSRLSLPLFLHPAADVVLNNGETAATFLARRVDELRAIGWRPAPGGDRATA